VAEREVERRLAAILAADVVGYSRLMEANEADTLAAMKAHRRELWTPMIEKYGGRIVGTAGDSIMVEFASAVAAVECAAAVQLGMTERNADQPEERRMLLRVGVNIGEVIVDGDDIYGDGVNVAARLEELAAPGGVCISGTVHEHAAGKLDLVFEDAGRHEVKNIARPIHVWHWTTVDAAATSAANAPAKTLTLPDKPSIAVLPFDNLSGEEEQEVFADGMAEDIITSLSRYRSLFVIARNSTFVYKGRSADLRELSRDLGVRYVLEGSVRRGGPRIRVTAQLIEGATGNHIWAERYDRELDDIFAVQDDITQAIVAAIGPEIDQAERDRAQRLTPENLDAWESYQRGLWHLYRFNRKDNTEAQELFKRAAAVAPNFAPAHSGLTHALYFSFMHGYAEDRQATLVEAYDAGRQAVAADKRDADAHFALGRILYLRHDLDTSIAEFEAAISHNPNFAHAHIGLGTALLYAGRFDRAVESCDLAVRLSPDDPLLWLALVVKGIALTCSKQYEGAVEATRQATRHPNAAWTAPCILASALGHLGETAQAEEVLADVLRVKPDLGADHLRQILPFRDPEHLDTIVDGLRKAGLSE
jgi:adenylate cyclase